MTDNAYTWSAIYLDGQAIHEFDGPDGGDRKFEEISKDNVSRLELLSFDGAQTHRIGVPVGAIPVFFRRRRRIINTMSGEETPGPTAHCIGWEYDGEHGKRARYLFVNEDGTTTIVHDSNDPEVA